MFDLYQINIRKSKHRQDLFAKFRSAIPDKYRQLLQGTLEAAKINKHGKFFADIERAMHDYMEDKNREIITPAKIRAAHKDAMGAVNEACIKLDAMYGMRGAADGKAMRREFTHQRSLEDAREYLGSLQGAIDSLPPRIPKTFHERALARRVAIAMPADVPQHLSATIESVFEQVLAIVFEMVDSTADAHSLAIKAVQDTAPIWVDRNNTATYRGKKRART